MINFFPVNINLGDDRNKYMCHYWRYSKKTLSIYTANWIPSNCYSASSIVWDFPWGDLTRLWLHELTVLYVSSSIFLTMHNIQPEFIKMISLSAVSRENTRSWNWYIAVKCINSWVLMPFTSCVVTTSEVVVLIVQHRWIFVYYKEAFQPPLPSQYCEMMKNTKDTPT